MAPIFLCVNDHLSPNWRRCRWPIGNKVDKVLKMRGKWLLVFLAFLSLLGTFPYKADAALPCNIVLTRIERTRHEGVYTVTRGTHQKNFHRTNRRLEKVRHFFANSPVRATAQKILDPDFLRGKQVLDIGAGDGDLVRDLVDEGVDAHGIDIVLSKEQRNSPNFTKGDALEMPFSDESFDICLSFQSVFTYYGDFDTGPEDKELWTAALLEAKRVTRNRGMILVDDVAKSRRVRQQKLQIIDQLGGLEVIEMAGEVNAKEAATPSGATSGKHRGLILQVFK